MNTKLLIELAEAYENGKTTLLPNMDEGVTKTPCGTVGCIAGEAAVMFGKPHSPLHRDGREVVGV